MSPFIFGRVYLGLLGDDLLPDALEGAVVADDGHDGVARRVRLQHLLPDRPMLGQHAEHALPLQAHLHLHIDQGLFQMLTNIDHPCVDPYIHSIPLTTRPDRARYCLRGGRI